MTEREKSFLREKFGGDCDLDAFQARLDGGEPLAYILGEWYFYDEVYTVTPDVLIPRPDTEHLVEAAIKHLKVGDRLLDLCCGSGCVGISAVRNSCGTSVLSCDISPAALDITRLNAERNGVSERVETRLVDVLDCDALRRLGRFPVVASNPPYIRREVILTLETVQHEPKLALDGGDDGLDFYRTLIDAFGDLVEVGGVMALEIGYDQGSDLRHLCRDSGLSCEVKRDYSGNERVVLIWK